MYIWNSLLKRTFQGSARKIIEVGHGPAMLESYFLLLSSGLCAMEVLPLALPSPPRQLSESEKIRMEDQEENTLRELRLFLRDVTKRLATDKRFNIFSKPVDIEEVLFQ